MHSVGAVSQIQGASGNTNKIIKIIPLVIFRFYTEAVKMGIQDFIDETTDRLQDEFGNTIPEHHLHSEAQKVVESFYSTHFSEESLPMVINETIGTYGYDWAEYCTSRQLGAMYYKRVK